MGKRKRPWKRASHAYVVSHTTYIDGRVANRLVYSVPREMTQPQVYEKASLDN